MEYYYWQWPLPLAPQQPQPGSLVMLSRFGFSSEPMVAKASVEVVDSIAATARIAPRREKLGLLISDVLQDITRRRVIRPSRRAVDRLVAPRGHCQVVVS